MSPRPRGTGSLYKQKDSAIWWLKYYRGGKPVRESSGTANRKTAEKILANKVAPALQAVTDPLASKVKVSELAADLLRDYRVNGKKSLVWAERRWALHLEPFFGNMRAVEVTTEVLDTYVDERLAAGAENATINRELAALKRAFNLGWKKSPRKVHQVPAFPHLEESAARSGFVDNAQYDKLCAHAGELWLRALLAVAYNFGFRKAELLGMQVRQVDLMERTITLEPGSTKNKEGRVVTMTSEVYELLKECVRGKEADAHVFTREVEPVRDFRGSWYALCERAGLGKWLKVKTEDKNGKARIRERWDGIIFHDLRRSAVRNMVRRGILEAVAMKISGHKTRSVFERYNITSDRDIAQAAVAIEQGASSRVRAEFGHRRQAPRQAHRA